MVGYYCLGLQQEETQLQSQEGVTTKKTINQILQSLPLSPLTPLTISGKKIYRYDCRNKLSLQDLESPYMDYDYKLIKWSLAEDKRHDMFEYIEDAKKSITITREIRTTAFPLNTNDHIAIIITFLWPLLITLPIIKWVKNTNQHIQEQQVLLNNSIIDLNKSKTFHIHDSMIERCSKQLFYFFKFLNILLKRL